MLDSWAGRNELRVNASSARRLNGAAAHVWHPALLVLDARRLDRATEVRRGIGYQPPDALVAQLLVGLGLRRLFHADAAPALDAFARAADLKSGAAAEALYWAGIAAFSLWRSRTFWPLKCTSRESGRTGEEEDGGP